MRPAGPVAGGWSPTYFRRRSRQARCEQRCSLAIVIACAAGIYVAPIRAIRADTFNVARLRMSREGRCSTSNNALIAARRRQLAGCARQSAAIYPRRWFLALPRLTGVLAAVPERTTVTVHLLANYLDHAAQQAISDWQRRHCATGGRVKIHNGLSGRQGPESKADRSAAHLSLVEVPSGAT